MGTLYSPLPVQPTSPGSAPSASGIAPFSLSSILGPPLGLDSSGSFALSVSGLAVQVGDRYVTAQISPTEEGGYEQLLDVTSLIIPNLSPYVYRLPSLTLRRGDLILISDSPISVRYVLGRRTGGRFSGLDPATGSVTDIVPAQNPFVSFFIRLVSLFNFPSGLFGSGGWRASGNRTPGREGEEMGERPELGILLASLLLNQQQSQTTTTTSSLQSLLPLLLLFGGQGIGLFELITLVTVLQQQSAGTGGQPLQGDGIALALLLLGFAQGPEGGAYRRWSPFERRERGFQPPAEGGPAA